MSCTHAERWQATRKRRQRDGGGDSGDKSGGEGGSEGGGNCGCESSSRGDGGSHTHDASLYTHVERWRATRERRQRDGGDDGGDEVGGEGGGEGGGKGGGKSGGCEAAHSGGGATAEERFERLESLERLERLESLAV